MEVAYSSDSCDSDSRDERTTDLSNLELTSELLEVELREQKTKSLATIEILLLNSNRLVNLSPLQIAPFNHLRVLNISSNHLTSLPDYILELPLTTLIARNNKLSNDSLPKSLLAKGATFREINLSGNLFHHFPDQMLELRQLKYLYLGGNSIQTIPKDVWRMRSLQVLSMPGNRLAEVPDTVGNLHCLQALILNDNSIEKIPGSIAWLSNLKSLYLHNNRLKHLPRDIITLRNLGELSLRDNPLVVRFVQDMALNPPSLLELSARVVKANEFKVTPADVPHTLLDYLENANCCVNPKCKGVFFDSRVEHIKFVDFCGKYRVPLMQYLCSSKCITKDAAQIAERRQRDMGEGHSGYMMRKVLLG